MIDSYHLLNSTRTIRPEVRLGQINGPTIDQLDLQQYGSAAWILYIGLCEENLSDTLRWDMKLQHTNERDRGYLPVQTEDIIGAELINPVDGTFLRIDGSGDEGTASNPGSIGAIYKVGYKGNRRFARVVGTNVGTMTTGIIIGIEGLRGYPTRSELTTSYL